MGVVVNKLRKHLGRQAEHYQLLSITTDILTKWKAILLRTEVKEQKGEAEKDVDEKEAQEETTRGQALPKEEKGMTQEVKTFTFMIGNGVANGNAGSLGKRSVTPIVESDASGAGKRGRTGSDSKEFMKPFLTGDEIRDKCFNMLLAAIRVDEDETRQEDPDELIMSLCRSIEECLYREFNHSVDQPYRARFRSRYLNLKDKNNAHLRKALLSGVISTERFCTMNAAEMASEERRRQDRLLMEQNLKDAKAAQDNEAETDQFRCGRCHQRKTKYYQLQTRSADEPMTTFVTCINCGNRWKFC